MDDGRRDLLQTLVSLVREARSGSCWDSSRAEELLRTQSSIEELKSIDVDGELIAAVWGNG